MSATTVWVALGSNLGNRAANLAGAVEALSCADDVEVLRVSPSLETRAEGGPANQPDFLNACLEARTSLPPEDFLWLLQRIETQFGRERSSEQRNGPRPLDLDLLLYGELVRESTDLVLPHPRMEERTFVLEPLCALAPDLLLARSGRSVRARLLELKRAHGLPLAEEGA